ncbi:major type 1 subunit fimbrin (pilin) [Acinetobacter calcoaceticus]|uniref:Major type 1 subunit fimbrin (Pilin) n=1 Tax=Acinetobacter calcoaceticus TaxID=471 RepID=A0A4R1Y909_ACICA|nr:major type 1 subunit fimbrin (pilin) [Acinetobacter calcoaceticus]
MNKYQIGFMLVATALTSTSVLAADGVITFSGNVVGETCKVDVNGAGSATTTVTLPTVNASSLATANQTAGTTPFNIALTGAGCTSNSMTAKPYFEPETSKVNANGRLINTGAAKNVDIQLLNQAQAPIDLSKDSSSQLFATGNTTADKTTYNYFARYFATGKSEAGPVNSSVSYSIIYK